MIHTLVVNAHVFAFLQSGARKFRLVRDKNNFRPGDTVLFQNQGTREQHSIKITEVQAPERGLMKGYVIITWDGVIEEPQAAPTSESL